MGGATKASPTSKKPRRRKQNFTAQSRRRSRPAEKLWAFRAILGERTAANGAKEYLIEWEDDPDTGEKYEPTWVGFCHFHLYMLGWMLIDVP